MFYPKLRGDIREKFATQAAFAEAMGMDSSTLSAKLNGRTEWTRAEISKACGLLDIPFEELHSYFFYADS